MSRASLAYPIAIGLAAGGWVTVLYLLADAPARVRTPLGLAVFACLAITVASFFVVQPLIALAKHAVTGSLPF